MEAGVTQWPLAKSAGDYRDIRVVPGARQSFHLARTIYYWKSRYCREGVKSRNASL